MSSFDPDRDYIEEYIDHWNKEVGRAKAWMVVLGVVLVLAGIAAAVSPMSMYAVIQGVTATVLIAHGITQIVGHFQTPEFFRSGVSVASGILNALLGIMLLALPALFTAGTLVFLFAFLLILSGIERMTFARQLSYYRIPASSAGTATGVLNIVLGVIFLFAPLMASLTLVYLIAGYLIVAGVTLIAESIAIKRIER